MAKFRKKPVVIEAVQFGPYSVPSVELLHHLDGSVYTITPDGVVIKTLEGEMLASPGDWIIKGVNGEFYPCKPDVFEKTYDAADEGPGEASDDIVPASLPITPMADLNPAQQDNYFDGLPNGQAQE